MQRTAWEASKVILSDNLSELEAEGPSDRECELMVGEFLTTVVCRIPLRGTWRH